MIGSKREWTRIETKSRERPLTERGRPRPQRRTSAAAASLVFEGVIWRPIVVVVLVGFAARHGITSQRPGTGADRSNRDAPVAGGLNWNARFLDSQRLAGLCESSIFQPRPSDKGVRAILPFRIRSIIFKGRTCSDLLGLWWEMAERRKIALNNSPI